MTYLMELEDASKNEELGALAGSVRGTLLEIDRLAFPVVQATDLAMVEPLAETILSLADRVSGDAIVQIGLKAKEQGVSPSIVIDPRVSKARQEARVVSVVMDQFQFKASTITVQKGWTVEWINNEVPRHTATADDDAFNSGTMSQGGTFSFTFNETGTFPYYCRFHGDKGGVAMSGSIIVQ